MPIKRPVAITKKLEFWLTIIKSEQIKPLIYERTWHMPHNTCYMLPPLLSPQSDINPNMQIEKKPTEMSP